MRRCGAPPRKEESEGRTPKINYVLTGTERSMTLTPMENTVAAVGSLKSNSEEAEEDNNKTRADFLLILQYRLRLLISICACL